MKLLYSTFIKFLVSVISILSGLESLKPSEFEYSPPVEQTGSAALLIAAKQGDVQEVEKLLAEEVSVNSTTAQGETPLILAAGQGNTAVVSLLIRKGAKLEASNKKGLTALHCAAMRGKLAVVAKLLDKGALVNIKDKSGYTPLYWACLKGHSEVAAFLLANGADINHPGHKGISPLHEASYQGNLEVAKLLLERGAIVDQTNDEGLTALHFAVIKGDAGLASFLIKRGADINMQSKEGFSPLHYAAARGMTDCINVLLWKGAKINSKDQSGRSPLLLAIINGEKEAVSLLIQNDADINQGDKYGNYPVLMAARVGDEEIAELLIEANSKILPGMIDHSDQEMTPLYFVRMFRKKNHKSLARLFKSHYPKLREMEKEHIHLKRLGHAWKIDGSFTASPKSEGFPPMTVRILGGRSTQFYRTMARGTLNYIYSCEVCQDCLNYQELYEMLSYGDELYERDTKEILSRILQGKPTPIHIGWNDEGHQVELLFWKNRLLLSNRGLGSKSPLEFFQFNLSLLNESIIQKILDLDGSSKEQFETKLFLTIAKHIDLHKGPFEKFAEKKVSLTFQTVDNCAWESTEGVVYAFFLLSPLQSYMQHNELALVNFPRQLEQLFKEQDKLFKKWLMFQQLDVLDRYIAHHNEEEAPYGRNNQLVDQIMNRIKQRKEIPSDQCLRSKLEHIKEKLNSRLQSVHSS